MADERHDRSLKITVLGLNYLRLSTLAEFAPLDTVTLLAQVAFHLFTILVFEDPAPRILSVGFLGLIIGGVGLGI